MRTSTADKHNKFAKILFAKILRGEADAHVVLDEEHCLAFMDLMPQSPGHTLAHRVKSRMRLNE